MAAEPAFDFADLRSELGVLSGSQLSNQICLPLPPQLRPVFPTGLRQGSTVGVTSTSVLLLLLSAITQQGSWVAICGFPELGVAAAQELGVDLTRCAFVPDASINVTKVIATLIDAVDVVVLRHVDLLAPADARRLIARARERKCVLMLHRTSLRGITPASVSVCESKWVRAAHGDGRLQGRWVSVESHGRGAMSKGAATTFWIGDGEPVALEEGTVDLDKRRRRGVKNVAKPLVEWQRGVVPS